MNNKAFTLIELLVVIVIVAVLSAIVLFSVSQYINKSKDAAIRGSLATMVPAGEKYYTNHNDNYEDFCDDNDVFDSVVALNNKKFCNIFFNPGYDDDGQKWAACGQLFQYPTKAFCVDSAGLQKDILESQCQSSRISCE